MIRNAVVLLGALVLVLIAADALLAQEMWPTYRGDPTERGPGDYLAWYKLLPVWILFVIWVRTTDWINRDTLELGDSIGMPAIVWNPVTVFSFPVAFLLAITLPFFAAGFPLLALSWVIPLATYIFLRNGRVTDEQKVLTPSHIKHWFADLGKGGRRKREAKSPHEMGPPVRLTAAGGSSQENQA